MSDANDGEFEVTIDKECARCGKAHPPMVASPLERPSVDADGTTWTHWTICPTNGQPIFVRQVEMSSSDVSEKVS